MSKKRVLLLVDGDMVAFSHCAAEEYGKEEDQISFAKIQMSMESKMLFIAQRVQATDTICVISGDENMRHVIFPEYKANRDGVWRPENLRNAKGALITMFNGIKKSGLEADDLISMLARFKYEIDIGKRGEIKSLNFQGIRDDYDEVVIASLDKDLGTIVQPDPRGAKIRYYRWETQDKGEKFSTCETPLGELKQLIKTDSKGRKKKEIKGLGIKFFLWQLLTGDSTDGIMGCGVLEDKIYKTGAKAGQAYQRRSGVGAVEAFELIDPVTSYAEGLKAVMTQYIIRFGDGWKDELVKNGRLLYMANMVDDGHLVRMWHYDPTVVDRFNLKTMQLEPSA